jgi:hypothetical protein
MFKFLRSKKNYPNCNLCIWENTCICTAQGNRPTNGVYSSYDCFKVFNTDETRIYKFNNEKDLKK